MDGNIWVDALKQKTEIYLNSLEHYLYLICLGQRVCVPEFLPEDKEHMHL